MKKHRHVKLQRLHKVRIWTFGLLAYQINSSEEVLKLKQNFQKNKVVISKTPFFVIHFVLTVLLVLTLSFDIVNFYENNAFSILVLLTKKQYSSFLKKVFVFQKFKVKVLKSLKTSTDCHINTCQSLKRKALLKIPSAVLQKNLCSFCWLQNETSKKSVFHC